ncbi:MAG: alpha/beta fold hydrolase [Terriglobales bacterium]
MLVSAGVAQAHPAFTVQVTGRGQAMIFIPGMNSSRATWDSTVARYQDHYTCYTLQLAGFAGQAPIAQPLLPTVKTELLAYVRVHHLDHPILVGHSLGGVIALDAAEQDPSLFGPVVIVDSLPFYPGAWFGAKNLTAAQPILKQMQTGMAQMTQAEYVAAAQSGAFTDSMTMSPAHQMELRQWSGASDMGTYERATIEMMNLDLRTGLARIRQPVLVLGTWKGWQQSMAAHGIKLTRADFVKSFQDQFASLPHLHFAMCDRSRHFVMWDDPAWFFSQIDAFLANPRRDVQNRGF